jgi:hypothetical protein
MSKSQIHEYFKRPSSGWNITEFLEDCDLELFDRKIESYITSLEAIANMGKGKKHDKAQLLLNNYRVVRVFFVGNAGISGVARFFENSYHSRLRVEPQSQCWGTGSFEFVWCLKPSR